MGKTKGDIVKDQESEYFKMVKVQWWVPMKKGSKLDEWHLYEDCCNGKWKCNLANLKQWLDILAIFSYFLSQKNTSSKSQISILPMYVARPKVKILLML